MKSFTTAILLAALTSISPGASAALSDADKNAVEIDLKQNIAVEYAVTIGLGEQRFRTSTHITEYERDPASVARQRALMGWKGDYLFIHQVCNALDEWRCAVDQVFTRDGAKLVYLGSVESGACTVPGCSYDGDTFTDLYDGLQINPVSGQVDAPPLRIARRIRDGRFVTDLDRSWELNKATYAASLACLDVVAQKGFAAPCEKGMKPWPALVFAAKLTHYTGRKAEREQLFAGPAAAYCAKSADKGCVKRVAGVKDFFSRFPPGDAPQFVPAAVVAIDPREAAASRTQKLETGKVIKLNF